MKWLGIIADRLRPAPPPPAPRLSDLVRAAAPERPLPSERDVRLVRDVAGHVASKVVPIVDMHGRTMENALQANVMAIEVALRLALEAAQRTALTAVVGGASLDDALAKLDAAIITIAEGLADHRPALAAAIVAAHAGIAGGQVRGGGDAGSTPPRRAR